MRAHDCLLCKVQKYESVENSSNQQPQFYRPHLDSIGGQSRRVATFVYFLSDVEEGGETFFPLIPVNSSSGQVRPRPGGWWHVESVDALCVCAEGQVVESADKSDVGGLSG